MSLDQQRRTAVLATLKELGASRVLDLGCGEGKLLRALLKDRQFTEIVGKPRSGQCAVFPVLGGQRVIALVYADNGPSNRAIEELDILELAAAQAGLAFENEMLRRQGPTK